MRVRLRPWHAWLWATLMIACLPRAARANTQVVLIQPEAGDSVLLEALFRLRGELSAVGFDVVTGPGPDHNPRWELEQASTPDTMVSVTLRRSEDDSGVDVWILDRLSGKTLIRRITVALASPSAPTVLAVRTTELLRASLLEATVDPPVNPAPRPPVPAVVARWMAPPRRALLADWSVDLGAEVLVSPGLGANVLPALRVGRGLYRSLALRLYGAATVAPSVSRTAVGEASLDQEILGADLAYALFADRVVAPTISLGAGVYHLGLTGRTTTAPYEGASSSRWTALLRGGLGVAFRMNARVSVLVDADVVVTLPAERVRIADEVIGTVGAPSFLGGVHCVILL